MAELVANCPRCGANKITFDLRDAFITGRSYDWQDHYEAFCHCRHCWKSTIFVLSDCTGGDYNYVHRTGLVNIAGAVNNWVKVEGIVSLKDMVTTKPPEHIPDNVEAVFREGATCYSVECYNAAGTMFRLCVDLATRPMLPEGEAEGLNMKTRRDLGLRLPWLFDNKLLPEELCDLSHCVREDGNDGAHAGTLSPNDATDLLDFTLMLLERIYTEPERIRLNKARRDQRRGEAE